MPTTPLRSHETEEVRPERRAAEVLLEQGDLEGARLRLEAYLATEPDDARARGLLGLCCFRLGLLDDAARLYAALVERNPGDATLRVNLGLVALKRGDSAEAAAQFEVAVSLAPTHRKALNYLGLALAQRGELALARDAFEKAGAGAMAERMAAQLAAAEQNVAVESAPATPASESAPAAAQAPHEEPAPAASAADLAAENGESAGADLAAPVEPREATIASTGLEAGPSAIGGAFAGPEGTAAEAPATAKDVSTLETFAAEDEDAFDVTAEAEEMPGGAERTVSNDRFTTALDRGPASTGVAGEFPKAAEFPRAADGSMAAAAPSPATTAADGAARQDDQAGAERADFAALPTLRWPEGRPFAIGPEAAAIEFATEVRTRLDGLVAARGVAAWTPVQKRYRGAEIDRLFGAGAQQMWRATGGGRLLFHTRDRTFTSLALAGETYFVEERVFAFDEGVRWENGRLPGQATDLHLVRFSGTGQVLVTSERSLLVEHIDGGCLSLPTTGLVGWSGALAPRLVGAEEGPAVPWIELSGSGSVLLIG